MADPVTVIGKETKISGNLSGDEDLTVRGRVEGSVQLARTLTIEPGGVVVAEVKVRDLVVSGVMVGNVTADDCVHITDSGRMVGDIAAPRVIIVDGAMFRGQVDMGDIEAQRPTGTVPARRPTAPAAAKVPAKPATQRVTVKGPAPKAPLKAPPPPPAPAKKAPAPTPTPPADLRRPAPEAKRPGPPPPVMPTRKEKVVVKKKK